MADGIVTDYDTLVARVKTYVARSDTTFSNQFPLFVALAEQRIYHGNGKPDDDLYSAPLRTKVMETTGTVTLVSGAAALPDDALDISRIYRDSDRTGLTFVPPHLWSTLNASAAGGNPYYYTVEAGTLKVTPSFDGDLSLLYYRKLNAITQDNKTGPLIAEHGMIYLNACMYEAFAFMQEVNLALAWLARYRAALDGANRTSKAIRSSGQRLRSIARAIG